MVKKSNPLTKNFTPVGQLLICLMGLAVLIIIAIIVYVIFIFVKQ